MTIPIRSRSKTATNEGGRGTGPPGMRGGDGGSMGVVIVLLFPGLCRDDAGPSKYRKPDYQCDNPKSDGLYDLAD